MERIIRKINLAYYMIYSLFIVTTVIGYVITMNRENTVDVKSQLSITMSSIVILYMIISIPGALALFHRYTKKISKIEDKFTKINKYTAAATWRLLAIGFGLILSVIAFYILRTESMIFSAGIAAIALFFCKPTAAKIASELELEESED